MKNTGDLGNIWAPGRPNPEHSPILGPNQEQFLHTGDLSLTKRRALYTAGQQDNLAHMQSTPNQPSESFLAKAMTTDRKPMDWKLIQISNLAQNFAAQDLLEGPITPILMWKRGQKDLMSFDLSEKELTETVQVIAEQCLELLSDRYGLSLVDLRPIPFVPVRLHPGYNSE